MARDGTKLQHGMEIHPATWQLVRYDRKHYPLSRLDFWIPKTSSNIITSKQYHITQCNITKQHYNSSYPWHFQQTFTFFSTALCSWVTVEGLLVTLARRGCHDGSPCPVVEKSMTIQSSKRGLVTFSRHGEYGGSVGSPMT